MIVSMFTCCAWEMVWVGRMAWEEGKMVGRGRLLMLPTPTLFSPDTVTAFRGVYGTVTPFGGDCNHNGLF